MIRKLTFAAPLACLMLVAPLGAQEAVPTPNGPAEQANMNRAAVIVSTIGEVLKDPEISDDEKNGMVGCLYDNTLKTVSEATGEALAENPQLDATDPVNVYIVAAIVCGAREAAPAPAAAE